MEDVIQYQHCPFCGSENFQDTLRVKDFTVSGKEFQIAHCWQCSGRFTQGAPAQNEIGKYYQSENYISHTDTREGLVNEMYHKVRKRTLRQKFTIVERETKIKKGSILDVGAGTGAFLNQMQQGGWQVTGLEPDRGAQQKAKELYALEFESPDQLFHLPQHHFNAITLWHVLEHVHDLKGYLSQLKLLLAPGGTLFIAVPNYTSYDALHYQQFWAAYDVPRHLYHFSPGCMEKLMTAHGLTIQRKIPMWYDSFYVSMLSEEYRTGKKNLLRAFIVGLASNMKALRKTERCSSVIYVVKDLSPDPSPKERGDKFLPK